jgi:hypothetical protein
VVTGGDFHSLIESNLGREIEQPKILNHLAPTDCTAPPPCPFCGGGLAIAPLIPHGFRIRIEHTQGCAIEAMAGITAPDKATLDDFLAAWERRDG